MSQDWESVQETVCPWLPKYTRSFTTCKHRDVLYDDLAGKLSENPL